VTEPNPARGNNLTTSYLYTPRNQLTQATMVRDGHTQTRTFLYSGTDLVSATNPENGKATYTYNGVHRVASRTSEWALAAESVLLLSGGRGGGVARDPVRRTESGSSGDG
jgi:YD repeat-containing protein